MGDHLAHPYRHCLMLDWHALALHIVLHVFSGFLKSAHAHTQVLGSDDNLAGLEVDARAWQQEAGGARGDARAGQGGGVGHVELGVVTLGENCLRPLITQRSPFLTARVCIIASGTSQCSRRSNAPRGSVSACDGRNDGSPAILAKQYSCRWRGATLASSIETFQICAGLSPRPESPREMSSDTMAIVCAFVAGSSGVPPNSLGMHSPRTPILCAPRSSSSVGRFCGAMSHSLIPFLRAKGMPPLIHESADGVAHHALLGEEVAFDQFLHFISNTGDYKKGV